MTAEAAEATLNSIGDAVLSIDTDGCITYLNEVAEHMTGWSRDAAAGRRLREVFHVINRDSRKRARDPLALAMRLNKSVGLTPNCVLVRRDGSETEIEDSAAPIRDRDGRITGAVIVFRSVGAAIELSRQMSRLAQHDSLTGLPNRMLLSDRLTEAIALGKRHQKPVATLFIDVDRFKDVNDTLGHIAGDRLLQAVATRLRGALRLSDTVSRYGGDEFVIVLSEIERASDVGIVAAKLLAAAAGPHRIGDQDVTVSVSVGIALFPDHGENADALITNADAAMYDAKRAGPGRYHIVEILPLESRDAVAI